MYRINGIMRATNYSEILKRHMIPSTMFRFFVIVVFLNFKALEQLKCEIYTLNQSHHKIGVCWDLCCEVPVLIGRSYGRAYYKVCYVNKLISI